MKDLHSNIKTLSAIPPAAIMAGNATKVSSTIDRDGFDSLEFSVQSGALTDGAYTTTVYEGDDPAMADEAAVADGDLIGTEPVFAAADDNTVKRVGYIGSKRYVRIKVVQTGAATGGFISAQAIQGHPKAAPVA